MILNGYFQFTEDFIKNCEERMVKDIFSKLIFSVLKKLRELYNVLPFLSKRINIEKVKKLVTW